MFQSFHGYEHLEKKILQKTCYHKHNTNKPEFTHQHKGSDRCLVCQFTFGSYVSTNTFLSQLETPQIEKFSFLFTIEAIPVFSGSMYSHRGPPSNTI